MTGPIGDETVPTLGRGVKFRFDDVRQSWVLLAPERLFVPDEQAVEILKLVDGVRSLGAIVDDLAERFKAPRELIQRDVSAMLGDLADKGAIRL
ncbi:MAG TPA: pyrroloquinoline quinone biosynthesis peptide chaperone PqqD [Aliidongia sp.]|nr:pyrroloquinoline quinone biosynthesis peptide chaperone PqqD [Aliidongia sp.]